MHFRYLTFFSSFVKRTQPHYSKRLTCSPTSVAALNRSTNRGEFFFLENRFSSCDFEFQALISPTNRIFRANMPLAGFGLQAATSTGNWTLTPNMAATCSLALQTCTHANTQTHLESRSLIGLFLLLHYSQAGETRLNMTRPTKAHKSPQRASACRPALCSLTLLRC